MPRSNATDITGGLFVSFYALAKYWRSSNTHMKWKKNLGNHGPEGFYNRWRKHESNAVLNPYPHEFHVSMSFLEYIEKYETLNSGDPLEDAQVSLAGRLMS